MTSETRTFTGLPGSSYTLSYGYNLAGQLTQLPDGELIPIYGGTSEEGFGSFLCEFMPLAAVKTIIVESEKRRGANEADLIRKHPR